MHLTYSNAVSGTSGLVAPQPGVVTGLTLDSDSVSQHSGLRQGGDVRRDCVHSTVLSTGAVRVSVRVVHRASSASVMSYVILISSCPTLLYATSNGVVLNRE